jgi:hypothetical protein
MQAAVVPVKAGSWHASGVRSAMGHGDPAV